MRLVVTLSALALSVVACEAEDRREARSVLEAIHRFRSADNPSIPSAVDALKATPCRDICGVKDACVVAGESTSKALRLKAEVEKALAALEKGDLSKDSDEAKALPKKLDEAESLLKEGHDALPKCDEGVQAMKRRYKI